MATQVTLNSGSVDSAGSLLLKTNGTTTAVTIDTSQNMGLGVTPSAWGYRNAFQIGTGGSLAAYNGGSAYASNVELSGNTYLNASASRRYIASDYATLYRQESGVHSWHYAASGTAGNAISFTQAMTLDASGNLGVGTTSPSYKLDIAKAGAGVTARIQNSSNSIGTYFYNDTTNAYIASEAAINNGMLMNTSSGYVAFVTGTGTERARIDSSGNLLVGTTSSNGRIASQSSTATNGSYSIYLQNATPALTFYVRGDGAINTGGAASSPYNNTVASSANALITSDGFLCRATSSLKYKKDVQDSTHGLADVLNLRSVTYKGKSEHDGDKVFGGLIAEEVHEAGLTEFVQYADDGTPDAIHYANMVSLAFKAIQEQQAIITQLQADVAALKG